MPERRKTVFVSCGQYSEEERELGRAICTLVGECTPFEGYFAQNQTTLEALSENVLKRLYESIGLVVIMHHRGTVEMPDRKLVRASVWIEQEIAIACLMQQILRRPLHIELFAQPGIAIEGIRQQLQLNGYPFSSSHEVIARLREILPSWTKPLYIGDEDLQKLVDSVNLSISITNGNNFNVTLSVENHSKVDVEIKSIVLWSKGIRVCKPVIPPDGTRWLVPAHRNIPIFFSANDDVAARLATIYERPPLQIFPPLRLLPEKFRSEVKIELRCEILTVTKLLEETGTVEVDPRNRQIIGL